MSEIDPVEFGKLIGSMQHLTTSITTLTEKVETLENKLNTGRGFILGMTIAAAGVGGSVGAYIHKIGDILK
jgi:hypothetical protein